MMSVSAAVPWNTGALATSCCGFFVSRSVERLDAHGDLAQRVDPLGDRAHRELEELRGACHQRVDRLVRGVDRAGAHRGVHAHPPVGLPQAHRGRGHALRRRRRPGAPRASRARPAASRPRGRAPRCPASATALRRSASALNRMNTRSSAASSKLYPSSSSRATSAARPECLPSTRLVCVTPTLSGRMIS